MSFGFRPEPIAIPVVQPSSSSLELPMPQDAVAAASAVPPILPAAAAAPEVEPFEHLRSSEIQHADLQVLYNIGHGSSGIVQKVLHVPSDSVLALKIIPVEADEAKRKQILLELKALHEASNPSIVTFYGAFYREGAVHVALEFMDASLLDISRGAGSALPEEIVAAIALPVLHGLVYMHREKHIIHRDIKPSNLLVDAHGHVKIADFGVSGELHHTLAKCASWVGTVHYMSPERIQGAAYSYDSDVWSLGITLLELATAAFPYPPERNGQRLSFWDLLDAIVESPPPTPPRHFGPAFHGFVLACLHKLPSERASSSQLLHHPLLAAARTVDLAAWLRDMLFRLPSRGTADEPGAATEMVGSATMAGGSADLDIAGLVAGGLGDTLEAAGGCFGSGGGLGGTVGASGEGAFGGGGLGHTLGGGGGRSGFGGGAGLSISVADFGGGGGASAFGGSGASGFGGDAQATAMLASIMGGGPPAPQPAAGGEHDQPMPMDAA